MALKDWEIQEKELARKHKGKRTPGSGAHAIKGDVVGDVFMIEAKHRNSASKEGSNFMDVQTEWFYKLIEESKSDRKQRVPMLEINIGNVVSYSIIRFLDWERLNKSVGVDVKLADIYNSGSNRIILDVIKKSQVRMHASQDYAYALIQTQDKEPESSYTTCVWVVLPDHEIHTLLMLLRSAAAATTENNTEEGQKLCPAEAKKKQQRTPSSYRPMSPERKQELKEKQRAQRKAQYQKKKEATQQNNQSSGKSSSNWTAS